MSTFAKLALPFFALFAASWPVSAQAPALAMLDRLERGEWTIRFRADGSTMRLCVRDGQELIQLRHRQSGCNQFVIQDEENVVTVQYTCRGNGYGRTTIRREGSRLVQLRSQGIQGGEPFSIEGEARQTGSC